MTKNAKSGIKQVAKRDYSKTIKLLTLGTSFTILTKR